MTPWIILKLKIIMKIARSDNINFNDEILIPALVQLPAF